MHDLLQDVGGYDIIFLDFKHGTDDIRRNAALFEAVVAWVNDNKVGGPTGGEQNVVLGLSMGGLVARYGLAHMEKTVPGSTHTRKLITHDSPHRGANTPLGIQYLTRYVSTSLEVQMLRFYNTLSGVSLFPFKEIFPAVTQAEDLLDDQKAPASRQLLLVWADRTGIGAAASITHHYNTFLDGEYRAMITPASGQSFPYEFVASSLGSQCGQPLYAPYTELVRIEANAHLLGLAGRTDYNTEVIVNALPAPGQTNRITSARLWLQRRVLGLPFQKYYFLNKSFQAPGSHAAAWDGLPGGTQDIEREELPIEPGFQSFNWWGPTGGSLNTALAPNFCFVPRASALDVPVLDQASLFNPYVANLNGGSPSRAARFIAQSDDPGAGPQRFNGFHISFPAQQAEWLYNEIDNRANNVACRGAAECTPVQSFAINGDAALCPGGTGSYGVANLPAGATVTWSVDPPGVLTPLSPSTGPTFQVQAPATTTTATVRALVGTCGTVPPLTLPVSIGPAFLSLSTPTPEACVTAIVNVNTSLFNAGGAALSVQNGTLQWEDGLGNGRVRLGESGATVVTATGQSACDGSPLTSSVTINTYQVTPGPGGPGSPGGTNCPITPEQRPAYAVYPNPAADELTIEESQRGAFQATLYDGQGQPRRQQQAPQGHLRLDTAPLPAGLYHLQLRRGNRVERRQIQITH